ncbi:hypothetical protein P5V93_23320 [Mycobacteroides abscessus subsp. abscessus]|uniref:hypothetical protein n=3 Tax=Mycobacteroides abscessus TaxID=36809 RepID=UPI0003184A5B|nr:hypothetical protein [Mycobacteroides abscessus]MDO3101052.1 hypothetical protein [Mycobacteroides abscessus subsp. abscessus]MDO3185015.1 hypothetical protein [Mycobacteroides abscessus subsp. abscessus]MDO3194362.1 hypothetical protein [Mycobacteroides abscessus subsp. abscessus]MDO3287443.1 hypothetical protein [Mycobacteroides abscessus subsp. abscessus]SHR23105.1 Uncharacterised protein [Mycobacteroides abscessus subsp. abscessus]
MTSSVVQSSPIQVATDTWRALARLLSPVGQDRVKVFDPETRDYKKTRKIANKLPELMAAVYIYVGRRTTLLVLDFDSKIHGAAQVDADFARALRWLRDCGARVITDRSSSGGRHILVPLAIGTSASFEELQPLMAQLAARLRTLDIGPMQKPVEGCVSVPGTRCSGGGFRTLDGSIAQAVDALAVRSEPTLLPALYALMGTLPDPAPPQPAADTPSGGGSDFTTGYGEDEQLVEAYWWTKAFPADVLEFAHVGIMARAWQSPSEARQAVVANAVLRGYPRGRIRALMAPGAEWSALGDSYRDKHGPRAESQYDRDFDKAIRYAIGYAAKTRSQTHKGNYTQFSELEAPDSVRSWLAYALAWTDRNFHGELRWTVRDVFCSMAALAVLTAETVSGIPVLGVGGRSLSLGTGLLSHRATANVLRRVREMIGSPIMLTRHCIGREPDYYALVANNPDAIEPVPVDRVRVALVHPAWSRLGRQHRWIYELIVHHGMSVPAQIYAAAGVHPRTGQDSVRFLVGEGLVTRTRGRLASGPVTLDSIAATYELDEVITARKQRYRRERQIWHAWLELREELRLHPDTTPADHAPLTPAYVREHHAEYMESVMANAPPEDDDPDTSSAVEMVRQIIGAHVLNSRTLIM